MKDIVCELCSDQPEIVYLHAACHLTAPLQATLDRNGTLILCCYLPECGREVARFQIAKIEKANSVLEK